MRSSSEKRNGMSFKEAAKLGNKKVQGIIKEKLRKRVEKYEENPVFCKGCQDKMGYEKRHNKFCSRSCSASFHNKGVRRNGKEPSSCLNCGERLEKSKSKYCSHKCQHSWQWEMKKKEIRESGEGSHHSVKKYLLELNGNKCEICKNTEWMEKKMPLVLDHVDGNSENNKLENFRLVCGNCDMQLPTYKNKNKGNGRHYRMKRYKEGKSY
jgi:hypothetical protein